MDNTNNFERLPYKRPVIVTKPSSGLIIKVMNTVWLKEVISGVTIPYEMSCFREINTPIDKPIQSYIAEQKLVDEHNVKQASFIMLKLHCVRVAELLKQKLLSFLIFYYRDDSTITKEYLIGLDFMNLRNILSKIVKSSASFSDIPTLGSKHIIKLFTKTFHNFIEDRNIYTHGTLVTNIDTHDVAIEYLLGNQEVTCIVSNDILQSFFFTYKILDDTLDEMQSIVQK
ncbi:hypothetical protein GS399_20340 [Pedobacter sp. HMF7647]|uniref:Uncharacterized protein n=1 Tax=Hufsiella arboris TaxID=2695275 RepID=A0A7K1YFW1_9SPHI|nr:hypothetical protein [Hufsiella arboris]MXV53321.1 hypothetical protein [Hufsiella arboris]